METSLELEKKIEALLFWKAEPFSISKLATILKSTEDEIKNAISSLELKLGGRGVIVVYNGDEVALGTSPELSSLIEQLTRDELAKDLGKAGLETLSIILYKGPISRKEIDYIRGVNSQFIVRNLLVRGLVERIPHPKDQRSFLYQATFETQKFLGISKMSDLPEYAAVQNEFQKFQETTEATE